MTVVTIRDGCAGDGPEARRRDVPYAGRRVRKGDGVLAELKHYLSRPNRAVRSLREIGRASQQRSHCVTTRAARCGSGSSVTE
jgi:hypothetical protein